MKPILLLIGTRPEAIKMLPVYFALKKHHLPVVLCATMQHADMLTDIFSLFKVVPEIKLSIMKPNQDLAGLTGTVLEKMQEVINAVNPGLLLVQGDTTSAMAASLAAFYAHVAVGHIEAGLRTENMRSPFPEEMNRRVISLVASRHYVPTPIAFANLLAEGIRRDTIVHAGNTVVDMLQSIMSALHEKRIAPDGHIERIIKQALVNKKNIIILTVHRRESFTEGIFNALSAVKEFAQNNEDSIILYPYHPNPHVLKAIENVNIAQAKNMVLLEPLLYKDFIYALQHASFVVTDSGGVFEEAITLQKEVLVLRNNTERIEGIQQGLGRLVGTDKESIVSALSEAKNAQKTVLVTSKNLYGTGNAAQIIVNDICKEYALVCNDYGVSNKRDLNTNLII